MKGFRKIFAAAVLLTAGIIGLINLSLFVIKMPDKGRPYRVEINRIALQIEQDGLESVALSGYEYVNDVVRYGDNFYGTASDYAVREINGELYRFDYKVPDRTADRQVLLIVNAGLGVMGIFVLGSLLFVEKRILAPFERFANLPCELAKGNLTVPVRESRNRLFGKFLWGMDLLRENLEQRKSRELELQREKKTLLLSLSHDIKTPLSAIKLYTKALSKNLYPDVDKQRMIAESISNKADEIEGYVSRIITASKEDFLSFEVENGEFYLSWLVETLSAYYGEKLALVKQEFVVGNYRERLLYGDPDRSVEVLQNIMENALKYGDGKRIELLFPEEDEEGVLIAVRNGGCTLAQEDLPHVFESFWRVANAGNRPGSGLGLYICRQLMHRMEGEIFAEMEGERITVTVVFRKA